MKFRYVYIAGPMTSSGDQIDNIRIAVEAASALFEVGFIPFVPHLCEFWNLIERFDYEKWMEYDFAIIDRFDAIYRLHGESKGADRECEYALKLGKPVFRTIDALMRASGCTRSSFD